MFGISKLWSAVTRLTGSLTALAETVDTVNAGIRVQVGLDHQAGGEPPLLPGLNTEEPAQAPARNGRKTRAATTA